jgi:cell division protein FtsQ
MRKRRTTNQRLTSERDQQKKHIIRGVVKRGTNPQLQAASRNAWRVIKSLFKCALLGALCYGAWLAYDRLFWRNPDYALTSYVPVVVDGSLTREQVLAAAGLTGHRNIFDYDIDSGREALKALPQVENADIRRYLPNRIEVTVTERKPVAWVMNDAKDDRTHLLDARGLVFMPKRILPEYEPLPVISGVELGDLIPGKPIRKSELLAALELLRRTRGGVGETEVLSIDVSKGYCLTATDQRHARVTFGLDDIPGQLECLAVIRNSAGSQEIETVNLMVAHNIPVTFVPQPDAEETDPAPDAEKPDKAERPKVLGTDPGRSTKPAPARKAEPSSKPKDTPSKGGVNFKKFRNA